MSSAIIWAPPARWTALLPSSEKQRGRDKNQTQRKKVRQNEYILKVVNENKLKLNIDILQISETNKNN